MDKLQFLVLITRNSWTNSLRILKFGGRVGHVTRHVQQLFKVKSQRSRSQGHAQEIYAVKGFSFGDARELTNLNRRRSPIKVV